MILEPRIPEIENISAKSRIEDFGDIFLRLYLKTDNPTTKAIVIKTPYR